MKYIFGKDRGKYAGNLDKSHIFKESEIIAEHLDEDKNIHRVYKNELIEVDTAKVASELNITIEEATKTVSAVVYSIFRMMTWEAGGFVYNGEM